jgi:hypothetical protein
MKGRHSKSTVTSTENVIIKVYTKPHSLNRRDMHGARNTFCQSLKILFTLLTDKAMGKKSKNVIKI